MIHFILYKLFMERINTHKNLKFHSYWPSAVMFSGINIVFFGKDAPFRASLAEAVGSFMDVEANLTPPRQQNPPARWNKDSSKSI